MSGFFDKTREDMQYIFKKGSTLSQSEKKHKLRAWATVIGIALVVVQLVFTVLTLLKLYKLDILPLKYIAAIDAVLVLVAIYDFLSQFTKTHIIGKVISILLSAVLLYTFLFTSKVDTTLDKISSNGNNVQEITDVVDVVVLKKDKAQSLSDTLSYTFGYNSTVDADDNQDAIQKINFNNNADIKTKEYTTWEDIIPALEAGTDIQAMLINDNTLSSFDEEYEEFLDSIRIVGTIELKRTIELSESDKKVNEEPFVIYISGNDEEGKILSTGRSDVNILCVIHPITRQVLLITTPRDAYINLTNPGTGAQGYDKLTHAGQWGIEGSILNLQNLYDLNIDYYVKINFTGCETIVDALGGVTINSSVDFVNGLEAAPTRYHYVIGDNECNGEQTLAFCRERNAFLDGDYQRGRNQLAALTAIINKLTSPAILAKYSAL
ncbi:MAG: LCP family protein, partial [Lachnospira sp.]|nr:LCP family protein [Lachnospira sp.]